MFFNLVVGKFENLQSILECCLSCLCLCKVICDFLVRKSLLYILIIEVDDSITIWEWLTLYAIVEDYFFFSIRVDSLYLAIMTYYLFNYFCIYWSLSMVFFREFKTVIFVLNCRSLISVSYVKTFPHIRILKASIFFVDFFIIILFPLFLFLWIFYFLLKYWIRMSSNIFFRNIDSVIIFFPPF